MEVNFGIKMEKDITELNRDNDMPVIITDETQEWYKNI
jgi:hypothetical protein